MISPFARIDAMSQATPDSEPHVETTPGPTDVPDSGSDVPIQPPGRTGPSRAFWTTLSVVFALAGAYVAYQRIGTTANIEQLEFTANLAGGFLALGMTDDEPGVLVLSRRDRAKVEIAAYMMANAVTGRATHVEIEVEKRPWRSRLRGPRMITIDLDGRVESASLPWTFEEFAAARDAVDCEKAILHNPTVRCGMPFADLFDFCKRLPDGKKPELLRQFLRPPVISHKLAATTAPASSATEAIQPKLDQP